VVIASKVNDFIFMDQFLKIFVGFDDREALAYHVFCQSIIEQCSAPVNIIPLCLKSLKKIYRESHHDGSNPFIYSRFLVPYLSNFRGTSLFFDGDMIFKTDPYELIPKDLDPNKAVSVVKHHYKTKFKTKYFGNKNEDYPRKNWTSVMIFNNAHPKNQILTPEFIQDQTGKYLHRLSWLEDHEIGELPLENNWLVNEYAHNNEASLLHYTLGIPCIEGFQNSDHAEEWFDCYRRAMSGYTLGSNSNTDSV